MLTLTQLILLLGAFAAGYRTESSQRFRAGATLSMGLGALSGAVAMAFLGVLAVIVDLVNLRSVLVNATPALVKVLTLDRGLPAGLGVLLAVGVVGGALGAV